MPSHFTFLEYSLEQYSIHCFELGGALIPRRRRDIDVRKKEKVSLLPDSKSSPESVPGCLNVGVNVPLGGPARTCSVARVVVRKDVAV